MSGEGQSMSQPKAPVLCPYPRQEVLRQHGAGSGASSWQQHSCGSVCVSGEIFMEGRLMSNKQGAA